MNTQTTNNSTNVLTITSRGFVKKDGKSVYGRMPYEFAFTDRDSYLVWRQEWKNTYKALSQEIRELKNSRSKHFKAGEIDKGASAASSAWSTSTDATFWLETLRGAKALSWEMKQQAKMLAGV